MTEFERTVIGGMGAILRALAFLLYPEHNREKQIELSMYLTEYSVLFIDSANSGVYPKDDDDEPA